MDKEEFRIKLEEINNLVDKKDYEGALKVVDSIDWRRVKNVRTLCVVGEIYAVNKRYEDSREIFLLAYHRAPIGKNILTRLIEVSLKMQDVESAQDFFNEFIEIAPEDSYRYVLEYKILTVLNETPEKRIPSLEKYKEKEFTEKYSYELAKLYYQNGDYQKCLDLCNEIILWFSEGLYVMKAVDLKQQLGLNNLSPSPEKEQETTDQAEEPDEKSDDEGPAGDDSLSIDSINVNSERDYSGVESLQEKITKGIRDIFGTRKDTEEDLSIQQSEQNIQEEDQAQAEESAEDGQNLEKAEGENADTTDIPESAAVTRQSIPSSSDPSDSEKEKQIIPEERKKQDIEEEGKEPVRQKENKKTEEKPEKESESSEQKKDEIPQAAEETENAAISPEPDKKEEIRNQNQDEDKASEKQNFNLESLILKQAEKQGIEIPEARENAPAEAINEADETNTEEKNAPEDGIMSVPDSVDQEKSAGKESLGAKKIISEPSEGTEADGISEGTETAPEAASDEAGRIKRKVAELEEEDFLTEEDLIQAEHEFYYGPGSAKEDRISEEEKKQEQEDKVFTQMLKESMEEEESVTEEEMKQDASSPSETENSFIPEEQNPSADTGKENPDALIPEEDVVQESIPQEPEQIVPEKKEPVRIVPRKNRLTEDEIKLFAYFVKVPGMREQLLDTLIDVQRAASDRTSKTGNIIVMGGKESGKTRLISSLIPAICNELGLKASKVAYVFADDINDKDINRIFEKLAGGFLVIEDANQLTSRTVAMLEKAMDQDTDGLIVIIEDEKISMRKLIARFPRFAKKFTTMINIPIFTNDELVNFARVYTVESGYKIDQMGMLSLYNKIGENQKEDEPMSIGAVKIILDNAIAKAEGGILRFNRKKRMDKDGFIVLHEKDFS